MKLYVVSSYPTKGCGISKYTQGLLDTLKQNDTDIISRRIFFYNQKKDVFLWFKFFFEILVTKPDVVHVQYTPTICGPILPLFAIFLRLSPIKTKIVLTAHEKPTAYLYHLKYTVLREIFTSYEKLIFKSCDKILVHTEEHKHEIMNRYKLNLNRVEIVPLAVMGSYVTNHIQVENMIKKYELSNNIKIITYFGFIRPTKGINYLIDAFSEVLKKRDDVTLLIAGKAPKTWLEYLTKLKNMVKSNNIEKYVKFTGYISDVDMPTLFNISKIIILPYTEVTQSGVLHQAIAYGKPVVVTDVGGIGEIVKRYNIGFTISTRDSRAIADAILNMLDNPEEMEMFKKNELKVAEELSQKNIAKMHVELYDRLRLL